MTEIFAKLKELVRDKTDGDLTSLTAESRFTDLGLDSLDLYELVYEVEAEFSLTISDEIAAGLSTIGDLVRVIEDK